MATRPKRRSQRNHTKQTSKPKEKDASEVRRDRLDRQRDARGRTGEMSGRKRLAARYMAGRGGSGWRVTPSRKVGSWFIWVGKAVVSIFAVVGVGTAVGSFLPQVLRIEM